MRQDAYINVTIRILDTENSNKEVATVQILKSLGYTAMGYDFSVADRIGEAYARAGKVLAGKVKKACK